MANSLEAMFQQNLAGGLSVLRPKFVILKKATNYAFDPIPGDRTTGVEVFATRRGTSSSVVPANVPPVAGDANTEKIIIPCDKWDETSFTLTDNEVASISDAKLRLLVQQKVADLADTITSNVMISAKNGIGAFTGVVGTAPFASTVQPAVTASRILNDNRVPNNDRTVLLSTSSYADAIMLPALQQWQNSGDPKVITEAELGRKFGLDWYWDNGIPDHTAGSAAGFLVAATPAGSNTTAISGGTGTFNVGDLFTVAGNAGKSYVVLAGTTATVLNYAPRNEAAWTASSAIAKIASRKNDFVLQKECLAFVTRSEVDMAAIARKVGTYDMVMSDPESGLSIRHKITQEHYQWRFAFSVLYGSKVIRPEFGVQIIS
jgi:hypothetical protein